jgi:uncharacterized DUF497 family protein
MLVNAYFVCILSPMNITYDPAKNKANLQKHQIDLAEIEGVFLR